MDSGKHTHVHIKTELKDCIRLNKSESFVNFIIKHALRFLRSCVGEEQRNSGVAECGLLRAVVGRAS